MSEKKKSTRKPAAQSVNFMQDDAAKLTAYSPGEQPLYDKTLIKLNTNENPYLPSKKSMAILRAISAQKIRMYPSFQGNLLKQKLISFYQAELDAIEIRQKNAVKNKGAKLRFTNNNFVFGNGSNDIISAIFKAFLLQANNHRSSVLLTRYTYTLYEVYANLYGVNIEVWKNNDNKNHRKQAVAHPLSLNFAELDFLAKSQANVFFITNPNSPTGLAVYSDVLASVVKAHPNMLFVIDEAYIDFSYQPIYSSLALPLLYPNVIVVRSFSKGYSMAGVRFGVGIAHPNLINVLNKTVDSYNTNVVAQTLVASVLDAPKFYFKNIEKIKKSRRYLTEQLQALGFDVLPSEANFVFAKTPTSVNAKNILQRLKEKNIYLRYFEQSGITDYLRITVGTQKEVSVLLKTLRFLLSHS